MKLSGSSGPLPHFIKFISVAVDTVGAIEVAKTLNFTWIIAI